MRSNNEPDSDAEFAATPLLSDALHALKEPVAVRAEWRDSVLREIADLPRPQTERNGFALWRPISIRPLYAIAACLAAMVVGAVAATTVLRPSVLPAVANGNNGDANHGVESNAPVQLQTASAGHKTIRFALVAPGASHVSIVGDFNGWDPKATPMSFARDGNTWLVDMPLSVGRHLYAFVVDGDIVADPSAARVVDDDFGVQNSVVLVGAP
ncbi:MAG: isoamylase early set domain-containing protein [Gemmatimonadaceae bacterium]